MKREFYTPTSLSKRLGGAISPRTLQRIAADIPGVFRTPKGHYRFRCDPIYSPFLEKWIAAQTKLPEPVQTWLYAEAFVESVAMQAAEIAARWRDLNKRRKLKPALKDRFRNAILALASIASEPPAIPIPP